MRLRRRRVLLGVTGSIAAYKAADLAHQLTKRGCQVRVVLTPAAARLVSPVLFSALTGEKASTDLFTEDPPMAHIQLEREADVIVVAPATADFLAKLAHGLADDLLSTLLLSRTHPVLVAPAMNAEMWRNPIVQENLRRLKEHGFRVLPVEEGLLACGEEGPGKMLEPEKIAEAVLEALSERDLSDVRILVTAGPTREFLDGMRFLSNPSSGKMGFWLARCAERRGAKVTLVLGPTHLDTGAFRGEVVRVISARDMWRAAEKVFPAVDIAIFAAAVSDYRPARKRPGKLRKAETPENWSLELTRNPDILQSLSSRRRAEQVLIGFAAEWGADLKKAKKKMAQKGVDAFFLNDISRPDIGFGADSNAGFWVEGEEVVEFPAMPKEELAELILDRARDLYFRKRGASDA